MKTLKKQLFYPFLFLLCILTNTLTVSALEVPAYSGDAYIYINNGIPNFDSSELTTTPFESYSELDSLGRCQTAYANVCQEIMPTEKRGSIGQVKPSGWQTIKYDNVDGGYLYNRCHLIGYQLSAENANPLNLITGTRYLNIQGMLPFENMVADFVSETNYHVLYRVTPIFSGNNLLADGVQIEAMSVEDEGEGILFNVYCYNVQPGISIDYATGDSQLASSDSSEETFTDSTGTEYILNTNTKKFHYPGCSSANRISEENRQSYFGDRDSLIQQGYSSCGNCNP